MSTPIQPSFPRDDRGPHFEVPEPPTADAPDSSSHAEQDAVPFEPWQEVQPGRFMPRRVRGSCVGRALG